MKLTYLAFLLICPSVLYSQVNHLDSLRAKKTTYQKSIARLNDSIAAIDSEIATIKSKVLQQRLKDSSVTAEVRKGAKLKMKPEFGSPVVLNLGKPRTLKLVDYQDHYFYACKDGKCGYLSEVWVVESKDVTDFKLMKNQERQARENAIKKEKMRQERIAREKARKEQEALKMKQDSIAAEEKKLFDEKRRIAREERAKSLKKRFGEKNANRILAKKVWLGMTKEMLRESLGTPSDINKTVGSWGVHEQWVYSKGNYENFYVYIENGKVTSWQDY